MSEEHPDPIHALECEVRQAAQKAAKDHALDTRLVSLPILGVTLMFGIELSITSREDVLEYLGHVKDILHDSHLTHTSWIDEEAFELKLLMGAHIWQSTRQDRFAMSIVRSMATTYTLASSTYIQSVHVRLARNPTTRRLSREQHQSLQDMACFLKISLLLNPNTLRLVCEHALEQGFVWGQSDVLLRLPSQVLESAVQNCLQRPMAAGVLESAKSALHDNEALSLLSETFDMSSVNQTAKQNHFVLLHAGGKNWDHYCAVHAPSTFWTTGLPQTCLKQIIIFHDRAIAALRNCIAVFFTRKPSDSELAKLIAHTKSTLLLSQGANLTVTEPCMNTEIWFRPDGIIQHNVIDKLLSPLLRKALKSRKSGVQQPRPASQVTSTRNAHHERFTVVFFVRRSCGDSFYSTSPLRQLCTMIEGLPEFLGQSENSTFLILYELCSSSAHPMPNREIFEFLPAEGATWIITTNPDRLTRRSDEVKPITEHLQTSGGGWLTSEQQSTPHAPKNNATSTRKSKSIETVQHCIDNLNTTAGAAGPDAVTHTERQANSLRVEISKVEKLKQRIAVIKIDEAARIQCHDGSFTNAIPGFIPPRMLFYSGKQGDVQNQMWATEWDLDIAAAVFMPYHPTIPIERNFDDDHGMGSVMLTTFATACREMWTLYLAPRLANQAAGRRVAAGIDPAVYKISTKNATIHRILRNLVQKKFDKPQRLTPGIGAVTVLSTTPLTTAKKRKTRDDYVKAETQVLKQSRAA
ncbi:hypothetical protein HDK90DRAFT_464695 [Phyllosticta capitalensis]|uniref:Uncharacterized protein n=1 Tax=Phyllosticta capitalensis TaxID=121624 RepID=A0ABR1YS83_9PEZI